MKPRTKARGIALQALYEIDMTGHVPQKVILERVTEAGLDEELSEFATTIALNVWSMVAVLDKFIGEHAPEWPLDQVAVIDRNILRIALWEFAVSGQTPVKVAINEAVELAKVYGSDSSPRFVNGVLGSLSSNQNQIQQALKRLDSNKTPPVQESTPPDLSS